MSHPYEGLPPAVVALLPRRRERWWLHGTLFVLAFAGMTLAGVLYVPALDPGAFRDPAEVTLRSLLVASALFYALPLALILVSHEMGHYLMCRKYGIDASPPYFIPLWYPGMLTFGTLGAFIRIREPMREKRHVFDVGVAGPIAGFVATLPFLIYGILHTHASVEAATQEAPLLFRYPLLVTFLQKALLGHTFDSRHVFEHPTFMAAWAGLFVTMFNLMPLGQLDGGHALYAVAGRRHRYLTIPLLLGLVALGFQFPTWWVLAVLVLVFGLRHPRVRDEEEPLGKARLLVAAGTLAIFVLCLMPVPFEFGSAPPRRPPRERGGTFVHQIHGHHRAEDPGRHL